MDRIVAATHDEHPRLGIPGRWCQPRGVEQNVHLSFTQCRVPVERHRAEPLHQEGMDSVSGGILTLGHPSIMSGNALFHNQCGVPAD